MLSGALRRLLFLLNRCSDYDDAHRCLLSVNGQSIKCSAYVADVCGFALQLICIHSVFAQDIIHHIISLSGYSDLIGKNCSIPDKAAFFICLIEPKNLYDFLRQFTPRYVPILLGQRSEFLGQRPLCSPGRKGNNGAPKRMVFPVFL